MTLALSDGFDLARCLRAVREQGAAYAEGALPESFRGRLDAEVSRGPFEPLQAYEGRARQQGELFHLHGDASGYPQVQRLRDDLVAGIREHASTADGLGEWQPNEVHVQRYPAGALGITPHLDLKRYRLLVAIFTVSGSAPFALCADREGTALSRWEAAAGSLVLLRGPGLGGVEDGRPLHAVSGPEVGHRVSLTLRMNWRLH